MGPQLKILRPHVWEYALLSLHKRSGDRSILQAMLQYSDDFSELVGIFNR
jgi:hypothetical protein